MAGTANTGTATAGDGTTITVLVEPAPADPEHLADLSALWGLFLVAAVAIYCMRRILDVFRTDHAD
jgi:hypothetical protein